MKLLFVTLIVLCFISLPSYAEINEMWELPDWSADSRIEASEGRPNPYLLSDSGYQVFNKQGRLHALWYPVDVTGLKIPFRPIQQLVTPGRNPFKKLVLKLAEASFDFSTLDDLYREMGLASYPTQENQESPTYYVPFVDGKKPDVRMGITTVKTPHSEYVTASCTACHSENLFGKPVIGLTNKAPRANKAFDLAAMLVPKIHPQVLKIFAGAKEGDIDLWKKAQQTMQWIGVKEPQVLGLDTSLAVVSISLSKRADDEYATITPDAYQNPRPTPLLKMVSDSKPMPWFTLKYKTRWLSDGSVISGNPILTNLLWNEIGRGVDLHELENWIEQEETKKKIIELTTAVFGTTPPLYTDFFPAESIPVNRAKVGQKLFENNCIQCHGRYEKAWDQENATELSATEQLKTTAVHYPKQTKIKDVGTDANRYQAMKELAPDLNKLRISQLMNIKVVPQEGYVPPPLVGIWSRWPYFHNNSAPTLCDVLLKPELRQKKWYVGSPLDKQNDFDSVCNGFPVLSKAPKAWRTKNRLFDTSKEGLSNSGHYIEDFTTQEIQNLVLFLKTL